MAEPDAMGDLHFELNAIVDQRWQEDMVHIDQGQRDVVKCISLFGQPTKQAQYEIARYRTPSEADGLDVIRIAEKVVYMACLVKHLSPICVRNQRATAESIINLEELSGADQPRVES